MKDYFSHDYYARNDKELVKVLMKHKLEGIGLYWCLIEMLYEEGGYLLFTEYERISFELRTNNELIKSLLFDFDLFEKDDKKFWSESVIDRLNLRAAKSEKARESINKRWEKYERNTNVKQSNIKRNTIKVKESKVKKKKVNIFIPPILDDVKQYFKENGYKEDTAIKMFKSYSINDWKDSNDKPVKNWKQKAINVWFKDENKINTQIKTGINLRKQLQNEKPIR